MPNIEEKLVDAVIEDNSEKPYFFPRMVAYIIDIILVSILSFAIGFAIPEDSNHEKYLEEYQKVQTSFTNQEITAEEYLSKSADIVYDVDYSNTPSMIIEVVVLVLYFMVFQYYNKGQTLGKKVMGLRVVSTKDNDLSLNQLAYRTLIINSILINILIIGSLLFLGRNYYYYSSLVLQVLEAVVIIATIIMIIVRKDGKGLHDVIASTKVVSTK